MDSSKKMLSSFLHAFHGVGNVLGIRCTACGCQTRSHVATSFGHWECNQCGRRCIALDQIN